MFNSKSFTSESNPNLNKVYLHQGKEFVLVDYSEVQKYLEQGWHYGKTDSKRCYVHRDGKYLRIDRHRLLEYLEEGWEYGAIGKPKKKK